MDNGSCPCCDSKFKTRSSYRNFAYFQCDLCSFRKVLASPRSDLYTENNASNFEGYLDRQKLDHADFSERILWIDDWSRCESILDVGANTGSFCTVAAENGSKTTALELNKYAIELLRGKGLEVWEDEIENCPRDQKFDFIHASDVIEHIAHPESFLGELSRRLKDNGRVFISTPDFDNPLVWPTQFVPPEHISLFNKKSLTHLVQKFGLQVIKSRRRSRTRDFRSSGRNSQKYPLIGFLYSFLENRQTLSTLASTIINFFVRENIELVAIKGGVSKRTDCQER